MAYQSQAGQANRGIKDKLLIATVAMPNAANNTNTNGIDLGAVVPYPLTESISILLSAAVATGANNKNVNLILQDSADNSTFANLANIGIPCAIVTGNTANHIANNYIVKLPPVTRRYVRVQAVGEANGGDASDGNVTMSVLL